LQTLQNLIRVTHFPTQAICKASVQSAETLFRSDIMAKCDREVAQLIGIFPRSSPSRWRAVISTCGDFSFREKAPRLQPVGA